MRNRQADERGARLVGLDYLRGFVIVLVVLDTDIGAIPKAAGVFTGALGLSWCSAAVLRSVVGLRRR